MNRTGGTLTGAGLVTLYTLVISGGDGIIKHVAALFEAPQLFSLSAALVVALSCATARVRGECELAFRTGAPRAMAARSLLTVVATISFFMAFRHLNFADVFLFIGLMPLIAAVLSGPVLGERVRPQGWAALVMGALGVYCLLPDGLAAIKAGHLWALAASVSGTGSIVASRYISRHGTHALAQVMYPNLSLVLVLGAAAPFVWRPMEAGDLAWVLAYGLSLFAARWILVEALTRVEAHVATPLMNLQFVWMVVIGYVAFGEVPAAGTLAGVALVMGSGLYLVVSGQAAPRRAMA